MPRRTPQIHAFILNECMQTAHHLARDVASHFKITRPAALKHIRALEQKGDIQHTGKTRGRTHILVYKTVHIFTNSITPVLQEDKVFHAEVAKLITSYPENVKRIIYHGFTEMFNNAIDHS